MIDSAHVGFDPDDTPELGRTSREIERLLRAGHLVHAPRQVGGTTALLRVVHDGPNPPTLIVSYSPVRAIYRNRWWAAFPGAPVLRVIVARAGAGQLRGHDRVYVDGLSRCEPRFVDECYGAAARVVGVW